MTQRVRRDVHAERAQRLAARGHTRHATGGTDAAQRPLRQVADGAGLVLVVPDNRDGHLSELDRQCIAACQDWAGERAVALVLAGPCHDDPGAAGVDRVIHASLARWADLVTRDDVFAVVLPESGWGGAHRARVLAAALGIAPATMVRRIEGNRVWRKAGGPHEIVVDVARVMTLAPGWFPAQSRMRGEAKLLDLVLGEGRAEAVQLVAPENPANLALGEADLIVSAGAGMADWDGFRALAARLGATIGGSRVVCDAGGLPRDRQVGSTGTLVNARGYIALGISGAPQHLQGIEGCAHVIAVNTDPAAPMLRRADLGCIADAGATIRALVKLAEKGA